MDVSILGEKAEVDGDFEEIPDSSDLPKNLTCSYEYSRIKDMEQCYTCGYLSSK